jgi:NADPH-dependent ferric siderophore reductase
VLREERGMPRRHVKATGYWLRTGDWILDED